MQVKYFGSGEDCGILFIRKFIKGVEMMKMLEEILNFNENFVA